jgi:hypothetical protein
MQMKILTPILLFIFLIIIMSCQKKDDLAPLLTLKGSDTIVHILNSKYTDEGATATDETDGNISSNIYIDNQVNENKIGEYTVTYHVVDQAGNEANPITRWVSVKNQGDIYSGYYSLKEIQLYPSNALCQYDIATNVDSTINFGLTFSSFACDFGEMVFAQVNDTIIVMSYQVLADSITSFSLQGNGYINDTLIQINYTLTKDNSTELWNATFERLK